MTRPDMTQPEQRNDVLDGLEETAVRDVFGGPDEPGREDILRDNGQLGRDDVLGGPGEPRTTNVLRDRPETR